MLFLLAMSSSSESDEECNHIPICAICDKRDNKICILCKCDKSCYCIKHSKKDSCKCARGLTALYYKLGCKESCVFKNEICNRLAQLLKEQPDYYGEVLLMHLFILRKTPADVVQLLNEADWSESDESEEHESDEPDAKHPCPSETR